MDNSLQSKILNWIKEASRNQVRKFNCPYLKIYSSKQKFVEAWNLEVWDAFLKKADFINNNEFRENSLVMHNVFSKKRIVEKPLIYKKYPSLIARKRWPKEISEELVDEFLSENLNIHRLKDVPNGLKIKLSPSVKKYLQGILDSRSKESRFQNKTTLKAHMSTSEIVTLLLAYGRSKSGVLNNGWYRELKATNLPKLLEIEKRAGWENKPLSPLQKVAKKTQKKKYNLTSHLLKLTTLESEILTFQHSTEEINKALALTGITTQDDLKEYPTIELLLRYRGEIYTFGSNTEPLSPDTELDLNKLG